MSIVSRIIFGGLVTAVLTLLHFVVFGISARVLGWSDVNILGLSFASALVIFIFNIGPKIKDTKITSTLYIVATSWLGVLFLLFSTLLVYELLHFTLGVESVLLWLHAVVLALGAALYAFFNAKKLIIKEYTITLQKLTEPVRVVHLSDVHIGTVHRTNFLERVVTMTNNCNPDLVLMTGDLFDGSASIHEEMLRPLDNLTAPTYFSTGNHEEYEGLSLVRETIQNLKMQLLDSTFVEAKGLQIIGINDRQSLPKDQSLRTILPTIAYRQDKPTILMYHTPVEWGQAREAGVDLMLSGHTHKGQLFPFTILVRFAYTYVEGLFHEAGKYLHITPGTGTWGPPMRLGSKNQITVLNLVPVK